MFGPNDVEEFIFQMKSDLKGLGYRGISQDTAVLGGHINLFGSHHPIKGKGKSKGIKGSVSHLLNSVLAVNQFKVNLLGEEIADVKMFISSKLPSLLVVIKIIL